MTGNQFKYAPIALFVYDRPWHTQKTLEALAENELIGQSELYIFADGPKETATREELRNISEVNSVISRMKMPCKTHVISSGKNLGLSKSILGGINYVFKNYERIIVVEDDIVTQKGFLKFLNEALEIYENENDVMHVGAYMHKLKGNLPETAMTRLMTCWGWATWKDSWKKFNPDPFDLLKKLEHKDIRKFDYNSSYNNYRMLKKNAAGKNDSWAIRWYTSIFLENGLCYNTTKSLTTNIGHDASGTHSFKSKSYQFDLVDYVKAEWIPVEENVLVRHALISFYWKLKLRETPNYIRHLISGKL